MSEYERKSSWQRECEYGDFRPIEPLGFESWWVKNFGTDEEITEGEEMAEYWLGRKMALLGWIASRQGWE